MLINVLIRTSNRPDLFARCLESIRAQSHKEIRVVVAYDNPEALNYLPDDVTRIQVTPAREFPYFWNLYCNELKAQVTAGWFFFLDDDDLLIDDRALERISAWLVNPSRGVICQFQRWGKPKPDSVMMATRRIIRGRIGMPCIFLHAMQKDVAAFDGYPAADFRFITAVSKKLQLTWAKVIVVKTDRISQGKCSM